MAINGTQFQHVTGRTRMQSAFPQITSFLTAWQVYTAVRISFNPELAAGISYWTERLIVRANNHPWLSVLNYAVAYFQKYQNAAPDTWFSADVELIVTAKGREQSWNCLQSLSGEIRQSFPFKYMSKLE